jgi:hypothetical protein
MKTRFHVLALCGLLTTFSGAALGAAPGDLNVMVPFAFSAGGTTLPAGTYQVSPAGNFQGLLAIRGARRGAFVLSSAPGLAKANDAPALVFARYRDRYFLHAVRFEDRSFTLPQTMEEREAVTGGAKHASTAEVITLQASLLHK